MRKDCILSYFKEILEDIFGVFVMAEKKKCSILSLNMNDLELQQFGVALQNLASYFDYELVITNKDAFTMHVDEEKHVK